MAPQPDPLDQMEQLVESSLPLVFSTYDDALRDRVREPVVLLIDCEDDVGREIAEAWLGGEAVDDAIVAVHAQAAEGPDADEPLTTVFARPMPLAACRKEIPPVFPYLRESFDRPPAEAVLVVAVTAGGAGTFSVPHASRPDPR
jgi:hypothetical protein